MPERQQAASDVGGYELEPSLAARIEVMTVTLALMLVSGGLSFVAAGLQVLWVALRAPDRLPGRLLLVPGKRLENGLPDADYCQRLNAAARLHEDSAGIIILGGVTNAGIQSEAEAGLAWLRQTCPPAAKVAKLEKVSTTTFENFRNVRSLIEPGTDCAVVSNRYHLARCLVQAASLGIRVAGIGAEASFRLPLRAWLRETWYLHLYFVGWQWARLRRHRELLSYLE